MNPTEEFTLIDVARRIGVSGPGVHHEVTRLIEAGFITDRREGNNRLIKAASDSIIARPLTDLLALTHGPLPVLTKALSGLPGVEKAYIYGSWAARYLGELGPIPKDVDVLIVGKTDLDNLYALAQSAGKKLHREVNIRWVSVESWEAAINSVITEGKEVNAFLSTVRSKPLVEIALPVKDQ